MLTSRISSPPLSNPSPEDIFSSSLATLFTDDTQNSHGIPGGSVIYTSPTFGPITLAIPSHPDVEEGRQLFAHYLWNAGVVAADLIECASTSATSKDEDPFNITNKTILELGAGTALPSILSALCSAHSIVITDHPSSPALTTSTIHRNTSQLFPPDSQLRTTASISIRGYVWGESRFQSTSKYGEPFPDAETNERFNRIIICDCLWMASQHANLVRSVSRWLDESADSCAIVIAGFHTGRSTVATFFNLATGEHTNTDTKSQDDASEGALTVAEIYEIDVDGTQREWARERPSETRDQAKRWCVVGILKRRGDK